MVDATKGGTAEAERQSVLQCCILQKEGVEQREVCKEGDRERERERSRERGLQSGEHRKMQATKFA